MKKKLNSISVLLTFLSLIAILIIQVDWIWKAANIQEKQFSHKVNQALTSIVDKMGEDKNMCVEVSGCFKSGSGMCYLKEQKKKEWKKVDSIIRRELELFHIDLKYNFEIIDTCVSEAQKDLKKSKIYSECLDKTLQMPGLRLKINFPRKSEFIINQIGVVFIASVILIILISWSFTRILRYYKKERQLAQDIKEFVNNIVHEFKTPLTNISLATNRIAEDKVVASSERLLRYTSILNEEHTKLRARVDEILYNAVADNGCNINCKELDLRGELQAIMKANEIKMLNSKGRIRLLAEEEKYIVKANEGIIHQIFSNLIDNSIKYSKDEPSIEIKLVKEDGKVIIHFSDKGIGIPKEDIRRVFERFYRVSTGDVHNTRGFGIGLWTVKKSIENIGGSIYLRSKINEGSTFIIRLPECNL